MSKLKEFSRRRFLRGAGKLVLPLPFLECFLNNNGTAWANGLPFQPVYLYALNGLSSGAGWRKTAVLNSNKNGYQQNEWNFYFPDRFGSNYNIDALIPLRPLKDVRNDVNIFTNLWIGRADGTEGAFANVALNFASHHTVALHGILSGNGKYTGRVSNDKFTGYRRPQNTTTSDHLVHEAMGKKGKLLSFHVEKVKHGSGHGPAISWKNSRDELPERNLTNAFNNLFNGLNPNATQSQAQSKILEQKSVIDLMLEDYNSIKRTISSADRQTVETHFEKIKQLQNEVNNQTVVENAICQIPNKPNINYTSGKTNYGNEQERAPILNKIITMAAACGVSHVFTYGLSHSRSGLFIEHFDKWVTNKNYEYGQERRDAHGNTHSTKLGENGNIKAFKEWHAWQASIYADLIKQFKAVKIGSDSLLDHSNLLYLIEAGHGEDFERDGSSVSPHSTHNMVAFNAGGKKLGIKTGQHIDGKKRHPLSLMTTAMKSMGISNPQVGEVKTIIDEILA